MRAKDAKVLYRSVRRIGPDTAPTKRLRKQGHNNVLVDCFMKGLNGVVPVGGRQAAVNMCLRWNSPREAQRIKWEEDEARFMRNENLRWRIRPKALFIKPLACYGLKFVECSAEFRFVWFPTGSLSFKNRRSLECS